MSGTAFLFPGQGSQSVGMGRDLFEQTELGRDIFLTADKVLGYPLSRICFEGPEEELKLTQNTQPALLTVSYILFRLLNRRPDLAAGHSLGEYSAFLCAGSLTFEDAVLLVHKRGKYMQEAVPVGRGAMAAIIGADIDRVRGILKAATGIVGLANWNSSKQVVISGEKNAVEKAVAEIAPPRSVFLPVSAPFHSPMMLPAEEKLAQDLRQVTFSDPEFPVFNNVDNELITSGDQAREGLIRQVSRPVRWHETMLNFLQEVQVSAFVEIGTGKVLSGLAKRTARELNIRAEIKNLQNAADIQNF